MGRHNEPLLQPNGHACLLEDGLVPRRRGLRPRLPAAVIRSKATLAFAAERQVVTRIRFA
jgi:hypothetical protein